MAAAIPFGGDAVKAGAMVARDIEKDEHIDDLGKPSLAAHKQG